MYNFDITNFTNLELHFENCEVLDLPIEAVISFDFLDLLENKKKKNSFSVSSFDLKLSILKIENSNSNMGVWRKSLTRRIFTNKDLILIRFISESENINIYCPWFKGVSDFDYKFFYKNQYQKNSFPSKDVLSISLNKENLSTSSSDFTFENVLYLNDFEKKILDEQIYSLKKLEEHLSTSITPSIEKDFKCEINSLKKIIENLSHISNESLFEHFYSIENKKTRLL